MFSGGQTFALSLKCGRDVCGISLADLRRICTEAYEAEGFRITSDSGAGDPAKVIYSFNGKDSRYMWEVSETFSSASGLHGCLNVCGGIDRRAPSEYAPEERNSYARVCRVSRFT